MLECGSYASCRGWIACRFGRRELSEFDDRIRRALHAAAEKAIDPTIALRAAFPVSRISFWCYRRSEDRRRAKTISDEVSIS